MQVKSFIHNNKLLTLSHYKEPLREVKGGYGYMGTIAETCDKTKIQCHICGELYSSLAGHIYRGHKITTKEYRNKFGISPSTPLCSQATSTKLMIDLNRHRLSPEERKLAHEKRARNRKQPKLTLEIDNVRGTCPDQTLKKVRELAEKLGHTPTPNEYRQEYNGQGGYEPVIRHFGSWPNAMIVAGLRPKKEARVIAFRYNKEELLQMMRDFYDEYGRTPTTADMDRRKLLPTGGTYSDRFGSLNKARCAAGIPILIQLKPFGPWVETMDYSLMKN